MNDGLIFRTVVPGFCFFSVLKFYYHRLWPRRITLYRFSTGADEIWRDLYTEMAERYIDPEFAREYVKNTIDQERALFRVPLTDENTKSWRMPLKGEDETGIWHQRYYAKGTKFSRS